MTTMTMTDIEHVPYKAEEALGRYVTQTDIDRFLKGLSTPFSIEVLGHSVQSRRIVSVKIGTGPKKVLIWSQMHGNESTTTKAVLDLMNFLQSGHEASKKLLEACSLCIIPMLNPDGAAAYTRVNANQVDLNRDAQELSQPESRLLRSLFEDFRPDFCFNLHDQRSIFNVGRTRQPATLSFLAPAADVRRSITSARRTSMSLIANINKALQQVIPGQLGRYDDTFNANCVGDAFQMEGTPTLLFEAGHFPGDYERELTRIYVFHALLVALEALATDTFLQRGTTGYFALPENGKLFYDILIRHAEVFDPDFEEDTSIAMLLKDRLRDGKVVFEPEIVKTGTIRNYFGHKVFDCLDVKQLRELRQAPYWDLVRP